MGHVGNQITVYIGAFSSKTLPSLYETVAWQPMVDMYQMKQSVCLAKPFADEDLGTCQPSLAIAKQADLKFVTCRCECTDHWKSHNKSQAAL